MMAGRLTINREQFPPIPAANPGFLAEARPKRYAATQPLIIPKEGVYHEILKCIPWNRKRRLVLVEFGFGTGEFILKLVRKLLEKKQSAHVIGFDLSPMMADFAQTSLEREFKSLSAETDLSQRTTVTVTLVSGVNCLDPDFNSALLPSCSVDGVMQVQFAHYAPNSGDSPLARKTREDGVRKITKAAWVRRIHEWLRPGGRLIDFDDFDSSCPLRNDISLCAWDLWALSQFTNPSRLKELDESNHGIAQSVAEYYPMTWPLPKLLEALSNRRQERRALCREETITLRQYVAHLTETFKGGHVQGRPNSLTFNHQRFHLLCAEKHKET